MNRFLIVLLMLSATTHDGLSQRVMSQERAAIRALNVNRPGTYFGATFLNANEIKVSSLDSTWSLNIGSDYGGINCLEFANQKNLLAIGTYDGMVQIWDFKENVRLHSIKAHEQQVSDLKFALDDQYIVSCGSDKRMARIDVKTGVFNAFFHTSILNTIAVHPTQTNFFLTGDHEGQIVLWDVAQGKKIKSITAHTSYVLDICFVGTSDTLLSASHDETIKAWDIKSYKQLQQYEGHRRAVCSIDVHPGDKAFASAGLDKSIRIWSLQTGKEVKCFSGHSDYVNIIRYLPDGSILSGSRDGTLRHWK
jgi:WD40 repeat protein